MHSFPPQPGPAAGMQLGAPPSMMPPPGVPGGMLPQLPSHMMQQMLDGMQHQAQAPGGVPSMHGYGGGPPLPQLPGMSLPPGLQPNFTTPQQAMDSVSSNPTLAALLVPRQQDTQPNALNARAASGMQQSAMMHHHSLAVQHQAPPAMQPPPGVPPGAADAGQGHGGRGGRTPEHLRHEEMDVGRGGVARRGPRETREQVEARERMAEVDKIKCHLHKKPKGGCKFCKKHQDLLGEAQKKWGGPGQGSNDRGRDRKRARKPDRAISEDRDNPERGGPLEIANMKTFGFSGLLQTHVVECAHFKSLLTLETFEQLVDETYQFANSVEPYMGNSSTLPSALFCCLYRFFTMGVDSLNLRRLIENPESPYIRCCGLLYVRFGLPHDQLLGWLGEYLIDDEEFKPSPDSDYKTTIGEYVETLLSQDKYYNTVLPRLPMVTKRHVEERLAPLGQNRKRMQANRNIIDIFREPGSRIECNVGGEWLLGSVMELDEDPPNRPKLRVRLDDGSEEYVHLGKVILAERTPGGHGRSRSRGRRTSGSGGYGGGSGGGSSRARSRSKHDWSREKGRSDKELIDEMRSREREKAVCTTGKDYARKPVGYKAACALPREQGAASYRLMEEETFVPMSQQKTRRSPTPERENFSRGRVSAEHQARMQQLFEKYGNVRAAEGSGRQDDGVDRPDVMRLG